MCYCPTPTLHLNLALTGDGAFLLSPPKTHTVWFLSILNYGDTENVLINHILLVIPMSYQCHYTNLCPHKPHKHARTHTHTHTHTRTHTLNACSSYFSHFFESQQGLVRSLSPWQQLNPALVQQSKNLCYPVNCGCQTTVSNSVFCCV